MAQFEMDTFAKSHDHMSNFWNSCYDALMSSNQRKEKEKAESRRKFQVDGHTGVGRWAGGLLGGQVQRKVTDGWVGGQVYSYIGR